MPQRLKKKLVKEIIKEINYSTKVILDLYGLGGTDLWKSVEWKYQNEAFVLWAYDYFVWVDKGRAPRTKRIPPLEIIKWMKKKRITPYPGQTYNDAAFHITNAIYKVGLKGKNYINNVTEDAQEIATIMIADVLSEAIAKEIAETMTFNLP